VTGAVVWDAPWRWGYWSYYNPYCTEVIVVEGTPVDYSRPIVVASPVVSTTQTTAQPVLAEVDTNPTLDDARAAFSQGDYSSALAKINQAIAAHPNDPLLHEFRALDFFAMEQYKAAAAAVYAVLSVGPGWDWATMSDFYPNVDVYTSQLRALERHRDQNPKAADIRFLLAYHYMTCGYSDSAVKELKEVVKLNPKDQLASQLLMGLSGEKVPAPQPEPSAASAPSLPVDAASLVGDWTASRPDGSAFAFTLGQDSAYTWKFDNGGQSQSYSGKYTLADGMLILKQDNNPVMIGQVTMVDGDRFNFKLVGDNPADPGLTFSKKK
jgi:tetratricopeptide (TPR) repeat protein